MFTVFHTADWHLGQSFHGYDRHDEHEAFLNWLTEQLRKHQPDALIVAGDIFDTINPSAKATRLYYDFLAELREQMPGLHVVITAGNHDSGSRLEAPADLLASLDISVVGTIQRNEDGNIDVDRLLVSLTDSDGQPEAVVIAMPFLRPSDVPRLDDVHDVYLDGITALYRQAYDLARERTAGLDVPIIAVGHCHVQGAAESPDSERRITIGGSEALSTAAFPGTASYVALGHLHKAQKFQSDRLCYSGSPIPLSFSERDYEHRVLRVAFDGSDLRKVTDLMVPQTVSLITLPAWPSTLDEVLEQIDKLPDKPQRQKTEESDNDDPTSDDEDNDRPPAFLEVRVLNDGPDPTRCRKIEDAVAAKHVRLASIKLEREEHVPEEAIRDDILSVDDLQTLDAEQMFAGAYQEKYEGEPDEAILAAFREIVAQVEAKQ